MGIADLDKIAKEKNLEIDEEMLDFIAGGVYSEEEWNGMTPEERMEAWRVSKINRAKHVYCKLD